MLVTDRSAADRCTGERLRRAGLDSDAAFDAIARLARQTRLSDLEMIGRARLGHIGSDFSSAIEFLKAVDRGLDRLDFQAVQKAQDQHDALTALRLAQQAFFSSL